MQNVINTPRDVEISVILCCLVTKSFSAQQELSKCKNETVLIDKIRSTKKLSIAIE